MDTSKEATIRLAKKYARQGQQDLWFEEFYARAEGDINKIYWADLKPNPLLAEWLQNHGVENSGNAAIVGCGLGDDAELLDRYGYKVTAFDISVSAISMCKMRYPTSKVQYVVADLFDLPQNWFRSFDLVYECNTIQILTGSNRVRALHNIADLIVPGGQVIVSCRSRRINEGLDEFPIALDLDEIDGFTREGLSEMSFYAYDDDQTPPVPHFFAVYGRAV